jgi:regulator of protease activity HflC (stomatin/prohibitin superfamily)
MRTIRMRDLSISLGLLVAALGTGCGYQALEPGHRGLRFEPRNGGLKPGILQPGTHHLGWCFLYDCGRVEDYDITYQTKKEAIHTPSSEGLALQLNVAVIYRPVVAELYALHTEIGQDYYEEVVGPEFRSATRSVLARHSYTNLVGKLGKIEDEIEAEVRGRIQGKHVEIASITLEQINYAPEIAAAVKAKIVGEQEAARQKALMENEANRRRIQLEQEAAQTKLKAENEANQARLAATHAADQEKRKAELALLEKQNERTLAEQQAAIDKMRTLADAETRVLRARAQAREISTLAKAHAEENRAQTLAHSPLTVQARAYDALGKLGGPGTTLYLGDWSKAPQYMLPRQGFYPGAFGAPFTLMPQAPVAPPAPAEQPAARQDVPNPYNK